MRFERFPFVFLLLLTLCVATAPIFGQSLTTGNISGTVFDPSHAVVPGATVILKSLEKGTTASDTTNSAGAFHFSLLKPGSYQLTVRQAGFGELVESTTVELGQTTTADLSLTVTKTTETVEVSAAAPLVNTEASINTPFTAQEVQQLPSAGGDITNIAQTSPGAVVNPTGGYGNFTVNGLPATSNLFTVNGENDMDPYFNINNSGASNLTLGQNEVSEATVVTNPYSGQYGQLAGAQVTYVTKSGSNNFHGNAQWWWNGRYLNANDWMNNNSGTPRAFSNANQYAASVGGPIIKDKTFFFADYEGLRFILPNTNQIYIPTPAFANAMLANIANVAHNELGVYTQIFDPTSGLYATAPGAGSAVPVAVAAGTPCAGVTSASLPGWTSGSPCTETFRSTPTAFAKEFIFGARVDQKLTNNDNTFFRYKLDHGLQPTTLDAINPKFDALSNQPAWDAQFQETHVFGSNATNSFTAAASHYVAQFQQGPQAVATLPYEIEGLSQPDDFTTFNAVEAFPQGRNITQYQFIDDFSWSRGKHTFKFGGNFRRYDVSDHNFFFNSPRVITNNLNELVNGRFFEYERALNKSSDVPIGIWGIGIYGEDDWKVTSNLKVTLVLRVEHNANPVCNTNCLANSVGPVSSLGSFQAALAGQDPGAVPYSSDIAYNQHNAFKSIDSLNYSPRVGFSWSPRSSNKTVISGGIGLFYDNPAAGLLDNLLSNPPAAVLLRVKGTPGVGVLAFDTTSAGAAATFQASAAAFDITQSYNTIHANLLAKGTAFNAPALTGLVGKIRSPQWQEWNFSVQQQLDRNTVLLLNYVGNHGIDIPYSNAYANAWDVCNCYNGAVRTSPVVPNYGTVTSWQSGAVSNYNGLTVTVKHQFSHSLAGHANYTWSHNIDEISNGGVFTYGDSLPGQINPLSLRTNNYGNSDYDIRHLFTADFVFNPAFHVEGAKRWAMNGWQFSGKVFWRTGLPFTIGDDNLSGAIANGPSIYPAIVTGNAQPGGCGEAAASAAGTSMTPCLNAAGLLDTFNFPAGGFPNQIRNQYHGPHYSDIDLSLFKDFKFAERVDFAIGAQAFNAFNHPNFGFPDGSTANGGLGDSTFGQISTMEGTPTSPYGNFLGFDSSPRVMQLTMKVVF
ncbi:MAG TPA: carboxypeptidase regulatory-like domain-containing protein [Candidatus Sulfotelmatobacter sp.]